MRRIGIIGLLIALSASGCATTGISTSGHRATSKPGIIHGTLAVSKEAAAHDAPKNLDDAVVYVESDVVKGKRKTTSTVQVVSRGGAFVPHVTVVTAGTTVEFHNADRVYHNAFSVSQSKRFKLGSKAPGQARSVRFDVPGTVNYYCELHPDESGFVLVLPGQVYAQADAAGAFALPPLPKGAYTVTAWHPHLGERRARVHLNGSDPINLRLRF